MSLRSRHGFTLIELLIVVAIIAILAAIAVPNFLEAQTRSKVARTKADLRSLETAFQAYRVDNNHFPKTRRSNSPPDGTYSFWWGFAPAELTTPVAYISAQPAMTFSDDYVLSFWQAMGGTRNNQPYTYIRNTNYVSTWVPGALMGNNATIGTHPISQEFHDKAAAASYITYTAGPDRVDSSVWHAPVIYDPTNGTTSFGDIHYFGTGGIRDKSGYVAGYGGNF
jgi:prepilin-type N-terminal cleavage/methylation domain-containing protein